jgi:hypothetical protein
MEIFLDGGWAYTWLGVARRRIRRLVDELVVDGYRVEL